MPAPSLLGHVGPRRLGGVQRFLYNSTLVDPTINPRSKSQTDDPVAPPIRPASHPVAAPPVAATAPAAVGSTGSYARTNASAVGASRVPETVGAPAAPRPRKSPKRRRCPRCFCPVGNVEESAHAPAKVWLSCPPACQIVPQPSSYIICGNALIGGVPILRSPAVRDGGRATQAPMLVGTRGPRVRFARLGDATLPLSRLF